MKRSFVSVLTVSVFLISSIAVTAFAGFDPTPFIGQLGAVENILNSANNRVVKVMGIPPDPVEPSPNLNGAVNRLEAINKQLVSADDMIFSIIEEVMGLDPGPFNEIIPALEGVRDAAQGIADEITEYLALPDPIILEFETALEAVQFSAQQIADNVNYYLELPSGCSSYDNPEDCDMAFGCDWDNDAGTCVSIPS